MPHPNALHMCLRGLMIFLSVVILMSGLTMFFLGIWIKYGIASFIEATGSFSSQLLTSSYICMGVGGALSLLGVIGFCGAWTQNRCLLLLYLCILSMMYIGQTLSTTVVLIYKDVMIAMVRAASRDSLMTAYMGPAATDPISRAWNGIMIKYKCCGFENSIQDFKSSVFSNNTGLLYPKTCCVDMTLPDCNGLDTVSNLIRQESCMTKLTEIIKDISVIISAVAAVMCLMQLASMIISLVLLVRLGAVHQLDTTTINP
ncbi:tetraspanin-16-like isoform X1 [Hoplias malabaricus]|uniref:tetraspanin-16-like isoform X1 n=1 Tax=Hoplias malabaricus TaxID=27720 RepID=UPI003461A196